MKSKKAVPMTPEIQSRLAECRQRAVEVASESGLFQVDDRFAGIIEPQLRTMAWELHGAPSVAPEVLGRREADLRQRADEASRRAAAFFEMVRDASLAVSPAGPMFGWRGCLIVLLVAALVGLAVPGVTLRGFAVLALSAALGVLALPLLPGAVRFSIGAVRGVAACARDLGAAAVAYHGCRELRCRAWA
ncbi:MAG: hypothetical protein NTW28_14805, partial [Candidatus Solibacter sp.]|nr:hypothetical protein [Candidatus Solibacter sp.]